MTYKFELFLITQERLINIKLFKPSLPLMLYIKLDI